MERMSVGNLKLCCEAIAGYWTTVVCVRDEDGGEKCSRDLITGLNTEAQYMEVQRE